MSGATSKFKQETTSSMGNDEISMSILIWNYKYKKNDKKVYKLKTKTFIPWLKITTTDTIEIANYGIFLYHMYVFTDKIHALNNFGE
jgi:hypothetical protein